MKCPKCGHEFDGYSVKCDNCNSYLLSSDYLNWIIEDCNKRYSNDKIIPLNFPSNDSKIIFKNILLDQQNDDYYLKYINYDLTPEEFAIEYYKHEGYQSFYAENNFWVVLFLMIYFYEDFIELALPVEQAFITAIHSETRIAEMENMDFNSLDNIPNLKNHVIKAYFENMYHFNKLCDLLEMDTSIDGLNKFFTIEELIVPILHLNNEQLKLIFKRMADGFKYYTAGLPDLIVYNEKEFFFAEVKSKEDYSSFKQIQWHKFLSEVAGIDVILFMIDKSDEQVVTIKKSYDIELEDSKERKNKFKKSNKSIFINWNDDNLKQQMVPVSKDKFNKLIDLRRKYSLQYKKYVVGEYTHLSPEDFGDFEEWSRYIDIRLAKRNDFIFEKSKELYNSTSFKDCRPTPKQLERNKKAKSFENNGEYAKAVDLYMENVIEKTCSSITYKQLVFIFNKFDRFDDVVKLMDIAIPIFVNMNDKTNSLRFIAQKFAAMNGNKSVNSKEFLSSDTLKSKKKKTTSKQMDLSSYFN